MAAPKATTLFHFTKSLKTLKSILLNCFYPYYCREDMSWRTRDPDSFIAFPLVSFCDIPIGRIAEHVKFYGTYGIGMSRQWGLEKGLNPILYVSETSPLTESIRTSFRGAVKLRKDLGEDDYINSMRHIAAFVKPIAGTMMVKDKPKRKEFYLENEWRYIAQGGGLEPYLKRDQYDDAPTRQKWNTQAEIHGKLEFSPEDVRYIFVPKDSAIPSLVNFIDCELAFHPSEKLKLLMTRITSLEHISKDM